MRLDEAIRHVKAEGKKEITFYRPKHELRHYCSINDNDIVVWAANRQDDVAWYVESILADDWEYLDYSEDKWNKYFEIMKLTSSGHYEVVDKRTQFTKAYRTRFECAVTAARLALKIDDAVEKFLLT